MTAAAAPDAYASRDGAAARLYVEYRERIYRFCLSRLRSREEAEDAVQNVFLRVHTALDRGVVPEFEAAWLYKIAHNVCLSRAESSARRTKHEALSAFDDELPIAAPEVSREELAGLSEALEAMPHNLRTALLLREWQGLSYAEIAAAMGLSVSAVETLLFRARRHLANALEPGTDKKKSVVLRVLDLLGLGWLRDVFMGAGPAAQLAAGAAVLAVGGGGAAIAMTTDAHSRPSPALPAIVSTETPAPQPVHFTTAAEPTAVKVRQAAAKELTRVTRALGIPLPVATPQTQPREPVAATTTVVESAPSATTTVQSALPSLSTTTAPLPSVSTPTTSDVPTVSVPTVSVPTASAPTVSVPSVTVPAVSLPDATGGLVGGK